jgi:hypothetical protein
VCVHKAHLLGEQVTWSRVHKAVRDWLFVGLGAQPPIIDALLPSSHHLIVNALPSAARLSRHPHRTHTYARTCSHMRAQTLRFATDIAAPSHTCPPWSASVHRALRHLGRVGICHPRVVRGVHKPTWSASAHRASGTWAAVRTWFTASQHSHLPVARR